MHKGFKFKWSALLSLVFFAASVCMDAMPCEASTPPRYLSETDKAIHENIKSSWSSSRKVAGKYTDVSFGIADDGKIYEPVVRVFSCDDQYDAECVEAICSMSPIVPPPNYHSAFLDHYVFKFGSESDLKPRYDGSDVSSYLVANPQPKEISYALGNVPFVVVHKIPLTVLTRYPGVFTEKELISPNNLIKIAFKPLDHKDNEFQPMYVRRIADLYAGWNEIFKQSNVTKSKILDWTKNIPPSL